MPRFTNLGRSSVNGPAAALIVTVFFASAGVAQTRPDVKAAVTQYYGEYLAKVPWGQASPASTFKSLSLGQRLTIGEGTPFRLCTATKGINGEDDCRDADFSRLRCPLTPPAITCTGIYITSVDQTDPMLKTIATAFGDRVTPSFMIALDDWFPASVDRRLSGRIEEITIRAENPSPDFVTNAIDHFTRSSGQRPQIKVDDKDKDIISRKCKQSVDELFGGKAKTLPEAEEALEKCETDSLEQFFISTTRSVYYSWSLSDPGFRGNKAVGMNVIRDLMSTRVIITMSYNAGEAERELSSKIEALVKSARDKHVKEDF